MPYNKFNPNSYGYNIIIPLTIITAIKIFVSIILSYNYLAYING